MDDPAATPHTDLRAASRRCGGTLEHVDLALAVGGPHVIHEAID
jgi:hypothetical protein